MKHSLAHYRGLVLEQRRQQAIAELPPELKHRGVNVFNGMVNPVPEIVRLMQMLDKFDNDFLLLSGQVIEPERNTEVNFEEASVDQINKAHSHLSQLMHDLLDEAIWQERQLDDEAEALQRETEGKAAA